MADLLHTFAAAAPWLGLSLLAAIFLANALGVVDQSVAVHELAATGVPNHAARWMVGAGRLAQLCAVPCLFFPSTRLFAAGVLIVFLIGATIAAHAFWKAPADARDRQLANFLKNVAIVGGLVLAAGWRD